MIWECNGVIIKASPVGGGPWRVFVCDRLRGKCVHRFQFNYRGNEFRLCHLFICSIRIATKNDLNSRLLLFHSASLVLLPEISWEVLTVWHKLLLSKLLSSGFCSFLYTFISSILLGYLISAVVDSNCSTSESIKHYATELWVFIFLDREESKAFFASSVPLLMDNHFPHKSHCSVASFSAFYQHANCIPSPLL